MTRGSGFTILELLLALSLAGLVMGTIIGLYSMMAVATEDISEGVSKDFDRIVAYESLQRTMQELLAATPMTPETSSSGGGSGGDAGGTLMGQAAADLAGSASAAGRVGAGGPTVFTPTVREDQPVMFDLAWVDIGDGVVVQRLELVTLRAPLPIDLLSDEELEVVPTPEQRARWGVPDSVRSVFEFLRTPDGGWALAWRPEDPPGRAVPLIDNLEWAEWEVLLRSGESNATEARRIEGWADVSSAFLKLDFPIAVRLRFKTLDGPERDWLFETLVEPREY